jgi:MarR family transcriptional regulator, organic hydroperoxide resistance regulator
MHTTDFSKFHEGLEGVLAHIIQGFMSFMKARGLSMPQIHALMYIYHSGECQVSDLGSLADVSPAAASQLTERLVQQGLVDRQEDPSNRRIKILRLSGKGRELIRESLVSNHFLMQVMGSLTPPQHQTVQAAFTILADAARQIEKDEKRKD